MIRIRHLAGAIAAALCFSAATHAGTFSQVVVFGDSLSDNGNISSLGDGPRMRFTTNPGEVAIERVADHYGFTLEPSTSGGTDYAWGGAQSAKDVDDGVVPSAQTQVNSYLAARGGRADGHALYSMWIGANDLLNLDFSQSLQGQLVTAAQAEVSSIKALQQAGANYIVVFNLPDVANTPAVNGTALATFAGQLGSLYNSTLNDGIASLGKGIVPVNTFALLNEAIANPALYGFTNVTQAACTTSSSINCTTSTLATPDAASTYLFADGVHPTTAAHALLAEVVLSELTAPQQVSLLGEAPLAAATAQTHAAGQQMLADGFGADSRVFVNVGYASQRFQHSDNSPRTNSNNVDLTIGADMRVNDQLSLGASLGAGRHNGDFSGGGGYQLKDVGALAYIDYHVEAGGYLGGYFNFGHSQFDDVERRIQLGPARRTESGDTSGDHVGAGLTGGWWFGDERLKTGPYANVEFQHINVDGYREAGDDSTAMYFGQQRRNALISTLGWRLQGQWQTSHALLTPYAELGWSHDSKADARTVSAGLNTLNGEFAMPGYQADRNWGDAELGLSAQFSRRFSGWLGFNGRFADDSQKYSSVNLGLKYTL